MLILCLDCYFKNRLSSLNIPISRLFPNFSQKLIDNSRVFWYTGFESKNELWQELEGSETTNGRNVVWKERPGRAAFSCFGVACILITSFLV